MTTKKHPNSSQHRHRMSWFLITKNIDPGLKRIPLVLSWCIFDIIAIGIFAIINPNYRNEINHASRNRNKDVFELLEDFIGCKCERE